MGFTFQPPGNSSTLLAIGKAAQGADSGIGVFAYASPSGVRAFFAIPEILALLKGKKKFHLVIGVDAITNASTLLTISDMQSKYGNKVLTAEAFLHSHPLSTFHPKFVQFETGKHLNLVTGSGNLTARGLGISSTANPAPGNWEAFSSESLKGPEAAQVQIDVSNWLVAYRANGFLRSLSDEEVQRRAMENGMVRFTTTKALPKSKKVSRKVDTQIHVVSTTGDAISDDQAILIHELSSNRQGQADVGKKALTEFFGYSGVEQNVLVQHVALDNTLGSPESPLLFINKSRNYRLELQAVGALNYEIAKDDSRMILVATKLDDRSFRYCVVPVTSKAHPKLLKLLGDKAVRKGRPMREKRISPAELVNGWKDVPSNLIPTNSIAIPI